MVQWYDTTLASKGADQMYRVSLRVPRNVPLDDLYCICAYRSDAPGTLLYVEDSLQPCKSRATRTVIRPGEAIQLRGSVLGDGRRVDILQRRTAAGRPSGRAPRGWTKVATLTATRVGVFRSGWKRPDRTTWYVARISGYYFPVYTPVVKVTVR